MLGSGFDKPDRGDQYEGGGWITLPPPPPPPPPPGAEPPRRRSRVRGIVAAVVAAAVLIAGGTGLGIGLSQHGPGSTGAVAQSGPDLSVQAIADKVTPGVVDITTYTRSYPGTVPLGAGTGMILTSSGLVLTNNHVVNGAWQIKVSVEGRSGTYAARLLGVSTAADVALLQIEGASGLPTVTIGDSSGVDLGEHVVAIGNALGQGGPPTVTSGHVSSLNRDISVGTDSPGVVEHLTGMIQSNIQISRGDSGGPLVDGSGEVVGMNTAAATNGPSQATSTIGYAIPINDAMTIVNQIRAGRSGPGIVLGQPSFLGVEVQALTPQIVSQLGLSVRSGALVVAVLPGMPAERAGIPQYAVITAVDGSRISSPQDLGPSIRAHRPGDTIRVTWVDRNGSHTATIRLVAGPAV